MSSAAVKQDTDRAKEEEEKEESPAELPKNNASVEKEQEAKLKAKYPGLAKNRGSGPNPMLTRRLTKGQKFFDSGDYNMVKSGKKPALPGQKLLLDHPTPETVPARKSSILPD